MFEGGGRWWEIQVASWWRCSGARSLPIPWSLSWSPWLPGNPLPPPHTIAPGAVRHHQAWNNKYFDNKTKYFRLRRWVWFLRYLWSRKKMIELSFYKLCAGWTDIQKTEGHTLLHHVLLFEPIVNIFSNILTILRPTLALIPNSDRWVLNNRKIWMIQDQDKMLNLFLNLLFLMSK